MLNGGLFTRDFLIEGICGTDAWHRLDDHAVASLRGRLAALLAELTKTRNPTEAETERDLIYPVLHAIGWTDLSVQQNLSAKSREDVPDALLFADGDAKAKAAPLPASYALDSEGRLGNDKTFILPTTRASLAAALNAPTMWWFNWRFLTHLKDEALSPMGYKMESLPVAPLNDDCQTLVDQTAKSVVVVRGANRAIQDWLRHEFGLDKPGRSLAEPHTLDADGFVSAVKAALPKSRKWSAAELARLKQEHTDTILPARETAATILGLERTLSDLVNEAYGLTPEEVALMWRTAPPRMPLDPAEELRRLTGAV